MSLAMDLQLCSAADSPLPVLGSFVGGLEDCPADRPSHRQRVGGFVGGREDRPATAHCLCQIWAVSGAVQRTAQRTARFSCFVFQMLFYVHWIGI